MVAIIFEGSPSTEEWAAMGVTSSNMGASRRAGGFFCNGIRDGAGLGVFTNESE